MLKGIDFNRNAAETKYRSNRKISSDCDGSRDQGSSYLDERVEKLQDKQKAMRLLQEHYRPKGLTR